VTLRVIQWATGGVGRAAIEGILAHPELELAGCWVHGAAKDGRDVGELIGRAPIGVKATRDVDALLALPADCVVYSPIVGNPAVVARILASGKNVVTPLGWFYPFASKTVGELEAACRKGGVTLHGTGILPGGITERFPLVISALSRAITHVRAEEWSDIRSYGAPQVIGEVMGFGKTPEQAKTSPMLQLLGAGFLQSVDMLAAALGFALDLITARVNWLMGEEHLDPAWSFGPGRERFEIEISGDPNVLTTFHGIHPESVVAGLVRNPGIVATAQHCVNAIPAVCAAEPGIRTYLDLPAYHGRAAHHLARVAG